VREKESLTGGLPNTSLVMEVMIGTQGYFTGRSLVVRSLGRSRRHMQLSRKSRFVVFDD
jgi:hypothetical protein